MAGRFQELDILILHLGGQAGPRAPATRTAKPTLALGPLLRLLWPFQPVMAPRDSSRASAQRPASGERGSRVHPCLPLRGCGGSWFSRAPAAGRRTRVKLSGHAPQRHPLFLQGPCSPDAWAAN